MVPSDFRKYKEQILLKEGIALGAYRYSGHDVAIAGPFVATKGSEGFQLFYCNDSQTGGHDPRVGHRGGATGTTLLCIHIFFIDSFLKQSRSLV